MRMKESLADLMTDFEVSTQQQIADTLEGTGCSYSIERDAIDRFPIFRLEASSEAAARRGRKALREAGYRFSRWAVRSAPYRISGWH